MIVGERDDFRRSEMGFYIPLLYKHGRTVSKHASQLLKLNEHQS